MNIPKVAVSLGTIGLPNDGKGVVVGQIRRLEGGLHRLEVVVAIAPETARLIVVVLELIDLHPGGERLVGLSVGVVVYALDGGTEIVGPAVNPRLSLV